LEQEGHIARALKFNRFSSLRWTGAWGEPLAAADRAG